MDQLQQDGLFTPPEMKSLEQILIAGLQMNRGRVLMDLWDVQQFSTCQHCGSQRATQMAEMNRTQIVRSGVVCSECG